MSSTSKTFVPHGHLTVELSKALEHRSRTYYKICLTHGDLTPHNILVDENVRPVALIDWETAGWMPEYWG